MSAWVFQDISNDKDGPFNLKQAESRGMQGASLQHDPRAACQADESPAAKQFLGSITGLLGFLFVVRNQKVQHSGIRAEAILDLGVRNHSLWFIIPRCGLRLCKAM